jgi:prepilin-type processing-associated H-X9-DG protein
MPDITQIWDWQAPIADVMGIDFEHGASQAQRIQRFVTLRDYKGFTCPENETIGVPFSGGPQFPVGKLVSYNTANEFLLLEPGKGTAGTTASSNGLSCPLGYAPMVSKVGPASKKVFIADGARFSNTTTSPDTDISYAGSGGGAYGSIGPFHTKDNSWNRNKSPGNSNSGTIDARIYAFRHGATIPGGAANSFKFNVGFYDGHAETMGDLQASDPNMWLPKGGGYDPGVSTAPLQPDAAAAFGITGPITIE